MSEPTITTYAVTGAAAAALGPVLGPWALLLFGAVAGSMLALGRAETKGWREALTFVGIGIAVSVCITGAAAWAVERFLDIPSTIAILPISLAIGAGRNAILAMIEGLFGAVVAIVTKRGGGGGGGE